MLRPRQGPQPLTFRVHSRLRQLLFLSAALYDVGEEEEGENGSGQGPSHRVPCQSMYVGFRDGFGRVALFSLFYLPL